MAKSCKGTATASGTQSIGRAVGLLKTLASRGTMGWRLVDVAAYCGLDKGTAHRVLACLIEERLVRQRASDRHYLPGPLLFELGFALQAHARFCEACNAPLLRLAKRPGDVAFLYLRSGGDFVCTSRVGSSSESFSMEAGARRPLVLAAGGMAILAALPRAEANRIVAENLKRLPQYTAQRKQILTSMLRYSRAKGYGVNLNAVAKANAFAVAIRDAEGAPFASISIAGPAAHYDDPDQERQVIALLREEADRVRLAAAGVLG